MALRSLSTWMKLEDVQSLKIDDIYNQIMQSKVNLVDYRKNLWRPATSKTATFQENGPRRASCRALSLPFAQSRSKPRGSLTKWPVIAVPGRMPGVLPLPGSASHNLDVFSKKTANNF